jgi:hypothetical protein
LWFSDVEKKMMVLYKGTTAQARNMNLKSGKVATVAIAVLAIATKIRAQGNRR